MSLKASNLGKEKIKQAIKEKGWNQDDEHFLKAASDILEPGKNWKDEGPYAYGVSEPTLKRFVYATRPIRTKVFMVFAEVLDLNWREIVESQPETSDNLASAPVESNFYGRESELAELNQWILLDRRLIILHGLGGIGKTILAVKLVENPREQFSKRIWRDFTYDLPVEELIADLLYQLCPDAAVPPKHQEILLSNLLNELKQNRILIVLDEQAAIGQEVSRYRLQREHYLNLWKKLGTSEHRSCILLTTREKPVDLTAQADNGRIQAMALLGIDEVAGQKILESKGLVVNESNSKSLIRLYGGNPLALKLVPSTVREWFNGNVDNFLQASIFLPPTIETMLEQQMQFIQPAEKKLLISLAESAEPLTQGELKEDLRVSTNDCLRAISALTRRSLLAKVSSGGQVLYELPPMVKEYVQRRLVSGF